MTRAVTVVVGSQWGDEGKGKLIDVLCPSFGVCARYNGGSNAGHTVVAEGTKIPLNLCPCAVLYEHVDNFLGNGMVIHLHTLLNETDRLKQHLNRDVLPRVSISSRAHLLFDFHKLADVYFEEFRTQNVENSIGTTRRGIGPAYASRALRLGVRAGDLVGDFAAFKRKYLLLLSHFRQRFGPKFIFDESEELRRHEGYAEVLRGRIVDGVQFIHGAMGAGRPILAEAANGTHLDVDFGTYPFVTSSNTTSGGACVGLGVPPSAVAEVLGVAKAYTTRVGAGPFPTELSDEIGELLQSQGQEWGTTTQRRRRCGWFDVPLVRTSIRLNGINALNVTKLDVLTGIPTLKICTAYRRDTGEMVDPLSFPEDLETVTPVYEELPGWEEPLGTARRLQDLPANAQAYLRTLEEALGVPVKWIGVGPDREQMIAVEVEDV